MSEQAPALRAADADRERTANLLRQHAGDGRLTPEELSERLDAAYAARTTGDLERLLADLPERPAAVAKPRRRWAVALLGDSTIDLRSLPPDEDVAVTAIVNLGDVEVLVPEDAAVELTGFTVLSDKQDEREVVRPGGRPVIRVRAFGILGDITVRSGPPKRRRGLLGLPPPLR